jgi:hypothetical protein
MKILEEEPGEIVVGARCRAGNRQRRIGARL